MLDFDNEIFKDFSKSVLGITEQNSITCRQDQSEHDQRRISRLDSAPVKR